MKELILKDTTFRDGLQAERVEVASFKDYLRALKAIDGLGVKYHEVGFVAASETIRKRIKAACRLGLSGRVCAFGRTHPDDAKAMLELHQEAGLPTAVLVGKTRKTDVRLALKKSPEENLGLIQGSVTQLVQSGLEVIFDAEHFFQAFWEDDREYCLKTLKVALQSGARWLVLCDTNGKMTQEKIVQAIRKTKKVLPIDCLGIHTHNDRGRALANAEAAWLEGVRLVEGTIGGVGERCGNLDLCTLMANLFFDYQAAGLSQNQLKNLTSTYLLVCDVLNLAPAKTQPWVGDSAFYTEAGMHQSGLNRNPGSYWHSQPEKVGNHSRVGVSDQSGRANLLAKAREFGLSLSEEALRRIGQRHKELVDQGANFGLAEASLHLFFLRELQLLPDFWEFKGFKLMIAMEKSRSIQSKANLWMVLDNQKQGQDAEGNGPVHALDRALRKTLLTTYPQLARVQLIDFKVRIVEARGTASQVRVLITFSDETKTWTTMAVHENIIAAAWEALLDGYLYKLVIEK